LAFDIQFPKCENRKIVTDNNLRHSEKEKTRDHLLFYIKNIEPNTVKVVPG